ncbi:MAG: hypothetical protein AEth_01119 [Candidatus Argoarchaeum ethanivorans]|uniref:RING-type domain-containing protein n=1 Tax=Candidatus Argoarchaeum ethanivorans TaxID=2608793 RepID=A0A8B3S399_9EURY|nr:MAG: hypothetical protein AEth_01119 [Candidatus Argoarchaeum ethanivorans]
MAKRRCDLCGKEREVGWPGAKLCPHCGAFLCSGCGSGKSTCPFCHKSY